MIFLDFNNRVKMIIYVYSKAIGCAFLTEGSWTKPLTSHFGNIFHPWALPIVKHKVKIS